MVIFIFILIYIIYRKNIYSNIYYKMDSKLMIEIMNARIQQLREENGGENEPFERKKDEINTDLIIFIIILHQST